MKEQKIIELELQLESLSKKFRANMRRLDSLILDESYIDGLVGLEASRLSSENFDDRLKLIRENFKINQERLDIFKMLHELRHNNKGFNKSNSQAQQPIQTFLIDWKKNYLLREDVLMVEIIDALS